MWFFPGRGNAGYLDRYLGKVPLGCMLGLAGYVSTVLCAVLRAPCSVLDSAGEALASCI